MQIYKKIYIKQGFTILEVIFVVAVFGIMVLVLTPFVRMAKERAYKVSCANNLRKISLGLHMYASDNKDTFPPTLSELCPKYISDEKVFDCPASKNRGTTQDPDYKYIAGFTEASSPGETIVEDYHANHKRAGKNTVSIDGTVKWVRGTAQ